MQKWEFCKFSYSNAVMGDGFISIEYFSPNGHTVDRKEYKKRTPMEYLIADAVVHLLNAGWEPIPVSEYMNRMYFKRPYQGK